MTMEASEEKRILDEFRILVQDLDRNDETLRQFLRARNHDLVSAETMLRNAMEWRKVNEVDEALEWTTDAEVVEKFPIEFPGLDNHNRPVMYVPLGAYPIWEMLDAGFKEEMTQYMLVCLERLMQEIKKTGQEQFTLIVDHTGSTYLKFAHYETLQLMFKLFRDFEANYPERLAEAWVVNTPYYLNYTWSLIKPILTGTTLSKVTFLSGNETQYLPTLLERMPESSLPARLRTFVK